MKRFQEYKCTACGNEFEMIAGCPYESGRCVDCEWRANNPPPPPSDAWGRIMADPALERARSKLSIHELRAIIRHVKAAPASPAADAEFIYRLRVAAVRSEDRYESDMMFEAADRLEGRHGEEG